MSLANLLLQRPAGYLMSDSGWFNRDGTIALLLPKVLTFPELGIAITARGQHDILAGILREIEVMRTRRPGATGAEVIAEFATLYSVACMAQGAPSKGVENACDMQVLYYSPELRRTLGFLISNETTMMPGLAPFTLQPVTCSFTGADTDAPFGVPIDVNDAEQFDVRINGRQLVERQRGTPWGMPGMPVGHYIAGQVHLTTVDASGVRSEVLHEWPDQVGCRVPIASVAT